MTILTLALKRPPLTSNDQRRAHWTTVRKAKADVELLVRAAAREAKTAPVGPCSVEIIWWAPDARIRDSDSLGPFLKASLDALVRCGVLARDDYRHVLGTTTRIAIDRVNPRIEIHLKETAA